ncbi:complex I NDUFA9 subunit family protein [Neptunicoccus cionae]|uniref:3-beta-hydroxy-Delta(5)-steroid dehydrogenase n=1 Tax=Neptunicoccus cionae TaxID=2035344 RepID=A0A916QXF8_9RHOB|nr:complex I NDUFA9 subunit family protein [Amylibacter cionae]GGA19099.1 3-beta-hydroxy-Delta(5)-steroid dehydrogenase [Amylibacter cionae]
MLQSPKVVTIFGGSGFVGRYIARRMAKEGWRVQVAVRRPNEAVFVRPYGVVGQVEPVLANIRNDESVAQIVANSDAVVNCVSVLQEHGKQTFEALNVEGAARIAKACAAAGVARLVHISALGANLESDSASARSKAEGEQEILKAFPTAMILRPSVIFGNEDQFLNRFAQMSSFTPVLPLFGGGSKFQPVYVDDVAQAACKGILGEAEPGIYELGGPDVESLSEIVKRMLHITRRRRLVINQPFFLGTILGKTLDMVQKLSLGLFTNTILTADQVKQLRNDNVVSNTAKSFANLDITPTSYETVAEQYLYRYRPSGQYAELTESARHMRGTPTTSDF